MRYLEGDELAEWRSKRRVAASKPGISDGPISTPEQVIAETKVPVIPLRARDTFDSMFSQMYPSMIASKQDYDRAIGWLRATSPGLAGYSDVELRAVLRVKVEDAVRTVIRDKGLDVPLVDLGAV